MAKLISPDGTELDVQPRIRLRGFTLQELYALIDCETVQAVSLADGRTMWMDEEAKLRDTWFVNEKATNLLIEAGGVPGDSVLGNVLITVPGEVK